MKKKVALTIAGSDPSGGAGIQQDIRVFTCLKVYSCAAITAITIQNSLGVKRVVPIEPDILKAQVEALLDDFTPDCLKLGMLATKENVLALKRLLGRVKNVPVVADPVMLSKNGSVLLSEEARASYIKELFPLIDIITPNLNEAQELSNKLITDISSMKEAGLIILDLMQKGRTSPFKPLVVLKGGHLDHKDESIDLICTEQEIFEIRAKRIKNINSHGTGCTFSSAICAYVAKGQDFIEAIKLSKEFVTGAIRAGFKLGHGIGPVDPMFFIN